MVEPFKSFLNEDWMLLKVGMNNYLLPLLSFVEGIDVCPRLTTNCYLDRKSFCTKSIRLYSTLPPLFSF